MFAKESLQADNGQRELTDPRAMRALAHPTRLALLELLAREGSLTATQAGKLLDESTASTSFHLRQLAKYGFIERDDGGKGRERPWRRVAEGQRWSQVAGDTERRAAASLLSSVLLEREVESLFKWLDNDEAEPLVWRDAAYGSQSIIYLTVEELTELGSHYAAWLDEHTHPERTGDAERRPADARAVKILSFAFPLPPTPSGN
jgi:predicted ArsR family transcriptional regulator